MARTPRPDRQGRQGETSKGRYVCRSSQGGEAPYVPFGVETVPEQRPVLPGRPALPGPRLAQGVAITPSSSDRRRARAAMRSVINPEESACDSKTGRGDCLHAR